MGTPLAARNPFIGKFRPFSIAGLTSYFESLIREAAREIDAVREGPWDFTWTEELWNHVAEAIERALDGE